MKVLKYLCLIALTCQLSYAEDITKNENEIFRFNFAGEYTEIYPVSNKPAPSGDVSSDRQYVVLGTFGLTLLPNTWNLSISYTTSLSESESWIKTTEYHVHDEGDNSMEIIDIYLKPFRTEVGDFGLGYSSNTFTISYVAGGTSRAVDSTYTLYDEFSGPFSTARIESNIKQYYATYHTPNNIDYVPEGFGLKVFMEESDLVRNLLGNYFVSHPDTTSLGIGIGINKTVDELKNGFSFKTLMATYISSTHEFHDNVQNRKISLDSTGSQFDIGIAYTWKKDSYSIFIVPNISYRQDSDVDETYRKGGLYMGFNF